MPFTVEFSPVALGQLADAWLKAVDKTALTQAEERIERELRREPDKFGRHLSEGLWIAEVPPIGLYFEIDFQLLMVKVTDVDFMESI